MRIGPEDVLPVGTAVVVGNFRGVVVESGTTRASNNSGGFICYHKIELSHKRQLIVANRCRWVEIKPRIKRPNYAFIDVIPNKSEVSA